MPLVLFPGQTLPLHIFEERYKEMLHRCIREKLPFGILLIQEGSTRFGRGAPHSVGTLAWLTAVTEIEEGRCPLQAPHHGNCYQIACKGGKRFRIVSLDRQSTSYLIADVEMYPDEPAPEPAMAMVGQRVASLFDEYYRKLLALSGGWQRETPAGERTLIFEDLVASQARGQTGEAKPEEPGPRIVPVPALPLEPDALSNFVASELNVPNDIRQELLEATSALTRLQREAELMAEETPQMEERLRIQNRRRFTAFGMSN